MQYGNDNGRNDHGFNNVEREIFRATDSVKRDVNNNSANVIASVNAQANADQAQTRQSQVEIRQSIERNADYINNNVQRASTDGLMATQNTSTATQLGVQNTSTATQLGIQTNSNIIQNSIAAGLAQAERIAGESRGLMYTHNQHVSSEHKSMQLQELHSRAEVKLQASDNKGSIELQASDNKGLIVLQASENKASIELQAANNKAFLEMQAANHKAFLENLITKTAAEGLLKTVESTSKLMDKIAECCCESKLGFATTQQLIVQSGSNSQVASLQQALANANQEALLARFTSLAPRV
jgi:hypothetical protein